MVVIGVSASQGATSSTVTVPVPTSSVIEKLKSVPQGIGSLAKVDVAGLPFMI